MSNSSLRGIFLSLILIFALSVISITINAYAEDEIGVKSFAFEKGTIIEFTNEGKEEVYSFRIWLGSDYNFESFKTEKGWLGEKTPVGVIIFTSAESVKQGESVKFGVKTNESKPGINWKALDEKGEQIEIGKSIAKDWTDNASTPMNTHPAGTSSTSTDPKILEIRSRKCQESKQSRVILAPVTAASPWW